MSSIFRSVKLFRYFANAGRSLFNYPLERDEGCSLNQSYQLRLYANQGFAQRIENLGTGLEANLRRIDQDVQRVGRVSRRDVEDLLDELRHSSSTTSSQSLLMIRCCGGLVLDEHPEVKTKLVQEIWNTLQSLQVPLDISHYNALLRVYIENDHNFDPMEMLDELSKRGILPNRITYQRLIQKYCKSGDIDGASRILELMKEKQMPINEPVFNSLILGQMEAGDIPSALKILDVMKQGGIEPSTETYTILLCGFAKVGDIDTIRETVTDLRKNDNYLTDKDYLEIAYTLAVNGHRDYVPLILSELRKLGGFHQDAFNIILRLLLKDQYETAYQVFQTTNRLESDNLSHGAFMIKQIVKLNKPFEEILNFCRRLENDGYNDKTISLACEFCLKYGNYHLALQLFDEFQRLGNDIRPHFFWPYLAARGRVNDFNGVIDIVNTMIDRYQIIPNNETLKDFIIPNLPSSTELVIKQLTDKGLSVNSIVSSIVMNKLSQFQIKEAAQITKQYPAKYMLSSMRIPLVQALLTTKDVQSYMNIVDTLLEFNSVILDDSTTNDAADILLYDVVHNSSKSSLDLVEKVMNSYLKCNFRISNEMAEKIEHRLAGDLSVEITILLAKLVSDAHSGSDSGPDSRKNITDRNLNVENLEKLIADCTLKGLDCNGYQSQLLIAYCRSNVVCDKLNKLLDDLLKPDSEFQLNAGHLAVLIQHYATVNDVEKVDLLIGKLRDFSENIQIDDWKLIKAAKMYVINDHFVKATDLLKSVSINRKTSQPFGYRLDVWRMLNHLASLGDVERLNDIFYILEENKFISVDSLILGPLINVHLVKGDLNRAMEVFEAISNKYFLTPMKNELCKKLIEIEDANNLQKVTDISTAVHGEVNSLYDLTFSFIECGRVRQARRILETPGLRQRPDKISILCERYANTGAQQHLEHLIAATKDLSHINRIDIYNNLLKVFVKNNEPDKAMNLWLQMQEDSVTSTDEFLFTLGTFLKKCGHIVPFHVPEIKQEDTSLSTSTDNNIKTSSDSSNSDDKLLSLKHFRRAVRKNKFDEIEKLQKTTYAHLSNRDKSDLIELYTRTGRYADAQNVLYEMLSKKAVPLYRVLQFYLNKLAFAGMYKECEELEDRLDIETKRHISYHNKVCNAYTAANMADQYLDMLEKDIDRATDLESLAECFPRGGIIGLLEKFPKLVARYEKLALKYYDKGIHSPMNCLWDYYFLAEDYESAKTIFRQYLSHEHKLMFTGILKAGTQRNNEQMFQELLDCIKPLSLTVNSKAMIYNNYLKVLQTLGKFDEIRDVLDTIRLSIGLEALNRDVLRSLNESARNAGVCLNLNFVPQPDETSS